MRGYLIVGVGGAVGAAGRWAIAEVVPVGPHGFPWATLIVNVVGCGLAGLAARHFARRAERWLLVVTGFLGGFTTYSSFAVQTRSLVDADRGATALLYIAATLLLGLGAAEVARAERGGR